VDEEQAEEVMLATIYNANKTKSRSMTRTDRVLVRLAIHNHPHVPYKALAARFGVDEGEVLSLVVGIADDVAMDKRLHCGPNR
jgi:hypothetical protein